MTYRYAGDDMVDDLPEYTITELPEGYAEDRDQRIEFGTQTFISYQNGDIDSAITLHYCYMQQGAATIFVLENAETNASAPTAFSQFLEICTGLRCIFSKALHHFRIVAVDDAIGKAVCEVFSGVGFCVIPQPGVLRFCKI